MKKYVDYSSRHLCITESLQRFISIRGLAASGIETMNSLWEGLGYHSRAARLPSTTQKVVKELGGRLPNDIKDMQTKIPGVCKYSAGTICSIAYYNECVPVVSRLLCRFHV